MAYFHCRTRTKPENKSIHFLKRSYFMFSLILQVQIIKITFSKDEIFQRWLTFITGLEPNQKLYPYSILGSNIANHTLLKTFKRDEIVEFETCRRFLPPTNYRTPSQFSFCALSSLKSKPFPENHIFAFYCISKNHTN